MNLPNKLTFLRVLMIPVFMILALRPAFGCQIAAVLVFVLASLTDMLDGKIARERNLITNFGKFADPIADKMLVMSAMVVLVGQGRFPSWVCVVILAREFIISGFRTVAVESGRVIAAGKLGKIKTVTQMVAIIMIFLFIPIKGDPLLGHFGVVLSQIAIYVCFAFTVISGTEYIVNNYDIIKDM